MLTLPAEGLLDEGGRLFGPHEWRGMRIPLGEVALDVPNQSPDGLEGAPAHRLAREDAEPRLDHVQPRGPRGGEVKVHLWMRRQPRVHGRRRMRGRVVEDDVQGAA